MNKRRGPGESFRRAPSPGEGRSAHDLEPDVEGHGIGDILTRPIDGVTGQPSTGHDGYVNLPRTGGENVPDLGPEQKRRD
jgi:hypothetical protein